MKIIRFISFLFIDVFCGGMKFFLAIPKEIWREFKEKESKRNL